MRKTLDERYEVGYLVRLGLAPIGFLYDWGALVINAGLSKPEIEVSCWINLENGDYHSLYDSFSLYP